MFLNLRYPDYFFSGSTRAKSSFNRSYRVSLPIKHYKCALTQSPAILHPRIRTFTCFSVRAFISISAGRLPLQPPAQCGVAFQGQTSSVRVPSVITHFNHTRSPYCKRGDAGTESACPLGFFSKVYYLVKWHWVRVKSIKLETVF